MTTWPIAADVDEVMRVLAAAEKADLGPEGITRVFDTLPSSLSPADLPALVNMPGAMTATPQGDDEYASEIQEDRRWQILLIVAPRGTGFPGEKFNKVTPWFSKMSRFLDSHQALGTANALKITINGDSGVTQTITYADTPYYGSRFDITITSRRRSPYAEDE